jgi:hypothetical protein
MKSSQRPVLPCDRDVLIIRAAVAAFVIVCLVAAKFVLDLSWLWVGLVVACALVATGLYLGRRSVKAALENHTRKAKAKKATSRARQRPSGKVEARVRHDDDNAMKLYSNIHYRHWKGAVRRSFTFVFGVLAIDAVAAYAWFMSPASIQSLLVLALLLANPAAYYVVARELYRARETRTFVRGSTLVIANPNKLLYMFMGGELRLPLRAIYATKPHEQTIMEKLFFKNVQTLTVDTAATEDKPAHAMRDMIDAMELLDAIEIRTADLDIRR